MTSAVLLLAAAALAAEPLDKSPLPDGRWSGPARCRAPRSAALKRAVLDVADDRLVLRGVDRRGVVIDEIPLVRLEDPPSDSFDPRLPRRGKPGDATRTVRVASSVEERPLEGKIEATRERDMAWLTLESSDKAGPFGGVCSATLRPEKKDKAK